MHSHPAATQTPLSGAQSPAHTNAIWSHVPIAKSCEDFCLYATVKDTTNRNDHLSADLVRRKPEPFFGLFKLAAKGIGALVNKIKHKKKKRDLSNLTSREMDLISRADPEELSVLFLPFFVMHDETLTILQVPRSSRATLSRSCPCSVSRHAIYRLSMRMSLSVTSLSLRICMPERWRMLRILKCTQFYS
jgi:hypothetical protein